MDRAWYQDGLRFECRECGHCCGGAPGYVWVDDAEIDRIADSLGMDFDAFEARFVRKVGRRKSLVEFPNGDCVFLDRFHNHCRIYALRPTQCGTWPFWGSNLESQTTWEAASRHCKGCNTGRLFTFEEIEERKNAREM